LRHVVVTAPAAQAALAERIAARLDGAVDTRGFVVEAVALAEAPGGAALPAMLAMPLRSWRLAGRLFGRLLAGASGGSSWRERALGLLVRAFGVGRGDFELLDLERDDAVALVPLPGLFMRALEDGALTRAVLVRAPRRAAAPLPAGYSAQLVLAPGSDLGLQAAAIADHVLALDFVSDGAAVAAERQPAVEPGRAAGREPASELGREPADATLDAARGRLKDGSPDAEDPAAAEGAAAPAPAEESPAEEAPAEARPAPAPSAFLIGGVLLVCASGLDTALRGDLVRAILLAHLAADSEAPALAQFDVWQRSFGRALANVGYRGSMDPFRTDSRVDADMADPLVAVEHLMLPAAQEERSQVAGDVLAAAWQQARVHGFGSVPNSLLGPSMPLGRFVLALADRAPDGLPRLFYVTLVQLPEVMTPEPPVQKAAVQSSAIEAPYGGRVWRYVQTSAGAIDASLLAAAGDALRERVAGHYDSMVVELPLDRPRPA
jgi:hypothetical protein